MKKTTLVFFVLGMLLALTCADAQIAGLLKQIEAKIIKLSANYELQPVTQGGIGDRIDTSLTQLLDTAKPEPQLPADVNCVPEQNCAPLIQGAINNAQEGATITINAGQHLLSSPVLINKARIHLRGQGRTRTVFTHRANIGTGGSSGIFHIGRDLPEPLPGITLSDFTIRADRGASPTMRTVAIRVRNRLEDLTIRDINFEGITSSCILLIGQHNRRINIYNNTCREYYEQFVEVAMQHSSDVSIANNVAYTTRGHPDLGATEPFPVAITPGHAGNLSGLIERVRITNNVFEHFMVDGAAAGNTVCVMLSEDQASKGYQFAFHDIYMIGNRCRGQGRGFKLQLFRTSLMPVTPSAYIAIEQNEFVHHVVEPIHIQKTGANPNDVVLIARNLTRLRESWPAYKIDIGGATVQKLGNTCIHPSKPEGPPYQCN
jgi:hypothetical protein